MLSIIIPTKNEEKCLPLLLNSISSQNYPAEVIVADNHSIDRTRKIAEEYDCKIVDGGILAEGRNRGAKASKGDLLLFIDADIIIPKGFLKQSVNEFYKRNLDIAGTQQKVILTGKRINDFQYNFFYWCANQWMKMMQNTKKPYMQVCMFAKRELHERIGGFNPLLIFAEDSEYSKRAAVLGARFGILESSKVFISPRRFDKSGSGLALKYLYFNTARLFGHEFGPNSKAKYDYDY